MLLLNLISVTASAIALLSAKRCYTIECRFSFTLDTANARMLQA